MNKKYEKLGTTKNCIGHFLILTFTITGRSSISAFGFLVHIPIGISSFVIGLKICAITAEIKNYNRSQYLRKRKNSMAK